MNCEWLTVGQLGFYRIGVLVWYNWGVMSAEIMERRGKLEDLDRTFDITFWQSQTSQARFDATWELIVHANRVKAKMLGNDVRQLRLQRSVETFQQQEW